MSQRNSGHARIARDAYETPTWVTHVLCAEIAGGTRLPVGARVWEPAAGRGQMVRALRECGLDVFASDIEAHPGLDRVGSFLIGLEPPARCRAIITNPPYGEADAFVRTALALMAPVKGIVAMLLKVDWDSGKSRRDLFAEHPAWGTKIVLTDRIVWFSPQPGDGSPSENHAWFVWDWEGPWQRGLRYAGAPDEVLAEIRARRRRGSSPPATPRLSSGVIVGAPDQDAGDRAVDVVTMEDGT